MTLSNAPPTCIWSHSGVDPWSYSLAWVPNGKLGAVSYACGPNWKHSIFVMFDYSTEWERRVKLLKYCLIWVTSVSWVGKEQDLLSQLTSLGGKLSMLEFIRDVTASSFIERNCESQWQMDNIENQEETSPRKCNTCRKHLYLDLALQCLDVIDNLIKNWCFANYLSTLKEIICSYIFSDSVHLKQEHYS